MMFIYLIQNLKTVFKRVQMTLSDFKAGINE